MASKLFNVVKGAKVKKSAFDLSHERKLSAEMGKLYPVLVQEVVPGDKFNISTQSLIRLAPLVAPLMHRVNSYIHYFYVPSRILWSDWEDFITNKQNITVPKKALYGEVTKGSLADHMGIPPNDYSLSQENINILPWYAYYQIYNDYYRDQNLVTEIDYKDSTFLSTLWAKQPLVRAWEKDYFTSALPTAQMGNPVQLQADFNYLGQSLLKQTSDGQPATPAGGLMYETGGGLKDSNDVEELRLENLSSIEIDVNEIRQATRLQRWMERSLRSGSRYVEHLRAHWGVNPRDSRLQRAEYIGGGKTPVVISAVANTGATEDVNGDPAGLPVGYMAGSGISVGSSNQASKYCEEHGYIIGIMSVIPEPNYMQGLPKFLSRMTNFDYYYPEFAQLGEMEVLKKEIMITPADQTSNNAVFGYQSIFADYKYQPSTVHGEFRDTLDHWTLVRKFANQPSLNQSFIECVPDSARIFAVTYDKEHLWIQLYHRITAVRPMPFFNDPML